MMLPRNSEGVLWAVFGSGMSYHARGADRIDNTVHAGENATVPEPTCRRV